MTEIMCRMMIFGYRFKVKHLARLILVVLLYASFWRGRVMNAQDLSPRLEAAIRSDDVVLRKDKCGVIRYAQLQGTNDDLRELCKIETLHELECGSSKITDAGMPEIGNLTNLRILSLHSTKITGKGLTVIPKLVHLEELSCNPKVDVRDAAEAIIQLPNLMKLNVDAGKFTDEDIQLLCKLKSLEELHFSGQHSEITDEALRDVAQLRSLRSLSCSTTSVGDKACEYLAKCSELRNLSIGDTCITDRGVERLAKLENLEELLIGGTSITSRSLEHLSRLPNLRELMIRENRLGDEIVPILLKFKKLDFLDAAKCDLSPKAARELKASRDWKYFGPDPEVGY